MKLLLSVFFFFFWGALSEVIYTRRTCTSTFTFSEALDASYLKVENIDRINRHASLRLGREIPETPGG